MKLSMCTMPSAVTTLEAVLRSDASDSRLLPPAPPKAACCMCHHYSACCLSRCACEHRGQQLGTCHVLDSMRSKVKRMVACGHKMTAIVPSRANISVSCTTTICHARTACQLDICCGAQPFVRCMSHGHASMHSPRITNLCPQLSSCTACAPCSIFALHCHLHSG